MKKQLGFFLGIGLIMLSVNGFTQSYALAAGLRMGNGPDVRTFGVTAAYRIFERTTIEGIAQSNFDDVYTAHIMIREHRPFITKRLNIYFGAGLSAGLERSRFEDEANNIVGYTTGNETMGVDLLAGIELTMLKYAVSLDVKPNFNMVGREPWIENQVGISVRPVIISGAKQNKRRRERDRAKKDRQREDRIQSGDTKFGDKFIEFFQKD
jgi:hypothetical protein